MGLFRGNIQIVAIKHVYVHFKCTALVTYNVLSYRYIHCKQDTFEFIFPIAREATSHSE